MATYTPKKLYTGQPGTGDTLLYTAPAGGALIKSITVTNTTGTAATITIGWAAGGALAAANHAMSAKSIPANDLYDMEVSHVLGNGETIRGLQGTSTALTVHISGIEIS